MLLNALRSITSLKMTWVSDLSRVIQELGTRIYLIMALNECPLGTELLSKCYKASVLLKTRDEMNLKEK